MTTERPSILIVEDEKPMLVALQSSLAAIGFEVNTVETASAGISAVARTVPDVVILDLGLPDLDGKEVIRSLREWTQSPILVLSARHDEDERIAALDLGADDYVTKPFRMGEFQARVRAAVRHGCRRKQASTRYAGRGLEIDYASRQVRLMGEDVRLTRKEFDLLCCMAQHAGQVVTHKQLLAAGWGAALADTQFVRVYVGQIRQKIEVDPSAPKLILTEPGIGYRLSTDD